MANSYMFDHGTRSAAIPRSTVAPRWNRNASTVSEVPMRAHKRRGRAPGADAISAPARRSRAVTSVMLSPPAATSSRSRARASFASTASAERRARSIA